MFYTFNNAWKLKAAREELGVKQSTISKEILSKNGNMTGWYSNIETGKNYVTEETVQPITKHLGLTYDDIVPKFYNQKTHHSVWNYDLDGRKRGHITPKPVALLENIIRHVTDEGDVVLDCFAGTSSTAVACLNLRRSYIMIEKNPAYCELSRQRIAHHPRNIND
jgi:site-specific DNA-methyltransferase (adenine-specific)